MYDIIRLIKRIFYKYPMRFWYTILVVFLILIMCGPVTKTMIKIIAPPAPTATPRPTPGINQEGEEGVPLRVLDTFYTLLGYDEFDSDCVKLEDSVLHEPTKGVVIEFWARHLGEDPITLNNFYIRDELGTNYVLKSAESISEKSNFCVPNISKAKSKPSTSISLKTGYGVHFYLYSFDIPVELENMEFSFQVDYQIPYQIMGTITDGASKIYIPMESPGEFADPSTDLMGPPTRQNLSSDRSAMIGDLAIAIRDTSRLGGDNGNTYYYLEILFNNVSDQMMPIKYENELEFAVIDNYGVPLPAGLSMNTGYNESLSPGETQKYYLTWEMEQKSVLKENMYLRIKYKTVDPNYFFIQIPFKESMIIPPTSTPSPEEILLSTQTALNAQNLATEYGYNYATPTPVNQCINTLPPRLKAGDWGGVTYTPPVANRLRNDPGFNGQILSVIKPGYTFYVMDGPVCADSLYWYYVNYQGVYGWTAESDKGQYWLEIRDEEEITW